jgi:hypothetical protein
VLGGDEEERADDDQDSHDMPPDRDVIEDGNEPDSESIEQPVQEKDHRVHGDDVRRVQRVVEELVEER